MSNKNALLVEDPLDIYRKKGSNWMSYKETGMESASPYAKEMAGNVEKVRNATIQEDKLAKQKADDMAYVADLYGTQQKVADDQHEAAVKAQEAARKEANRQAYIGQELIQKYLPQYQAAQGTLGMGTSATEAANAYNAYLGRVSGNNANYADNVAELDAAKAIADANRKQAQAAAEKDVLDFYREKEDLLAEETSAGFEGLLANRADYLMNNNTDGKLSQADYDSLLAYVEANRSRLTESGWQNVQDLLESYRLNIRSADDQAAADKNAYIEKGVTLSRGLSDYSDPGNNFWVKDANGKEYAVELVGETQDSTVIDQANKADSGEVFAYGGKLYLKSGSKVYEIDRRKISKHDEFEALYNLYFGGRNPAAESAQKGQQIPAQENAYISDAENEQVEAYRWHNSLHNGGADGVSWAVPSENEMIGREVYVETDKNASEKVTVLGLAQNAPATMEYAREGVVYSESGTKYVRLNGKVYEVE